MRFIVFGLITNKIGMKTNSKDRLRFLIVEDNPGDLLLISTELYGTNLGVEVIESADRLSVAIEKIKQSCYHIILLDLSLPDSAGIDTFRRIQQESSHIPVIILSGLSDMSVALEAINLGAQDYLIKGDFDGKMLSKTILYGIERKRNLEEIKANNERYELAARATSDLIWDWDIISNRVTRNPYAWQKLMRSSPDHPSDHNGDWFTRVHPDDIGMLRAQVDRFFQDPSQEVIEAEFRIRRDDDTWAYVVDHAYALRDESGKPIRLIGAVQDITERKRAEAVLRDSEERYRYLFNNNPAAIIIWDYQTHRVLEVNNTAEEIYGYTNAEFLQMPFTQLCGESQLEELDELIRMVDESPEFKSVATWVHLDKQENELYMNISSHKIDYQGRAVILALANNITENVLLEQELEEERHIKQQQITNAIIAAQEQERREMGTELHDNINQILATSRLYLDCALTDDNLRLKLMQDSRNFIVNAMSEIRKLSKSLLPPSLNRVGLIETLDDLISSLRPVNKIEFKTDWSNFDESRVPDKMRLTIFRIAQEQLNNIIKHSKASTVFISLSLVDGTVDLEIIDNGVGFDVAKKRSGVGLQNINTRASQHKGTMAVFSELGKGCQLIVKFPLSDADTTERTWGDQLAPIS